MVASEKCRLPCVQMRQPLAILYTYIPSLARDKMARDFAESQKQMYTPSQAGVQHTHNNANGTTALGVLLLSHEVNFESSLAKTLGWTEILSVLEGYVWQPCLAVSTMKVNNHLSSKFGLATSIRSSVHLSWNCS